MRYMMISLLFVASGVGASDFDAYLKQVSERALGEGISPSTIEQAFSGLEPDERVIGFDRRQPEFVQTFDQYLEARVSDFRKQEGRRLYVQHRDLLEEIARQYGVDPAYIVAFWGLETSFGRYQGKYSIVRSLATLGHDPRRSAFFTSELIHALKILDEKHISLERFVGAWAGAMGQSQFMPGSFLRFARDHDGDGRKDIWHSKADVFASIANYLREAGWRQGRGWGKAVQLPDTDLSSLKAKTWDTRCRALKYHSVPQLPGQWAQQGFDVTGLFRDEAYALIQPEEGATSSYFAGGNFRAILSYNCANKYAVSVGLLAEVIVPPS